MRAETHNLIRDGRHHPHLAALEASLVENERLARSLLQPGVDTAVAATLFMTAARIGADIFMSSVGDDDGARRQAAGRFTETLRHLLLHGMLDAEKYQRFAENLAARQDDADSQDETP
ncbi:hypothetical protein GGQ88_002196 [Novosphingobium hassiacum]|uniref:Uncharacterized protein n=1 Tax=Novosphingobium hassiacum TaxID=173676 RepID=A0A7W6EW18_9SPHN|nr:hypothetical protein [Novosphingobium hassiacum]MBB3860927.1 hypothetical protein [Novosphingobium hassiacum]